MQVASAHDGFNGYCLILLTAAVSVWRWQIWGAELSRGRQTGGEPICRPSYQPSSSFWSSPAPLLSSLDAGQRPDCCLSLPSMVTLASESDTTAELLFEAFVCMCYASLSACLSPHFRDVGPAVIANHLSHLMLIKSEIKLCSVHVLQQHSEDWRLNTLD